jgi:hypothetical protein
MVLYRSRRCGIMYRQDADPLDEDEAKLATVLLESAGYEVERLDYDRP